MERKKKVKILLINFIISLLLILPISNISILYENKKETYEQNFDKKSPFLRSSSKSDFFTYYKEITIDHTKVSGSSDLINFPVLISIVDSDLHNYTQSDGDDIAFAINDTWLDHEIEFYNRDYTITQAKLVAWVRIPSLSPSTDTIIKMYYGNSTIGPTENPEGVWDSNYSGIWHLHDDFNDSTNCSNHGTNYGSSDAVGKIGDAQDFAGYNFNQEITIEPNETLNPNYITVTAWIYPRGQLTEPSITGFIVSDYLWEDGKRVYYLFQHPNDRIYITVYWNDGNTTSELWSSPISLNMWHLVGFTVSSSTLALYIDGSCVATTSITGGIEQYLNTIEIGDEQQLGDPADHEFNGTIDEVRISSTARSADWIATEFNNQNNPNNFYSVGSSQKVDPTPPSWSNLIETEPLGLGEAELVSIDVYDLYGVAQVLFEIESTNYTMVNIGGNTWQNDTWIPSSIGDYNYIIYMQDTNDNWNMTIGSIFVIDRSDNIPPLWFNLFESADPLELGNSESITIDVFDANGTRQVLLEIESTNYTMVNIGGNTWKNDTWTPTSIGDYDYTIYMQDNNNNWNTTTGSIQVLDNSPPSWSNLIETEPLELGNAELISIDVFDLSGVDQVLFEIENINYTMTNIGGNTWQNNTWIPSSTGDYDYTIYMEDVNNYWNTTTGSIQVIDTILPTYSALIESEDPLELGDTEIITINATDLSGINQVLIEIGGINYTMEHISGDTWQNSSWTPGNANIYVYTIYIQDNNGNWESVSGSVEVIDTILPSWSNLVESADPLELGNTETITIDAMDISGINQVLIEINGKANYTMEYVGGNTWRNNSWIPTIIGSHNYTIYIQDNNNNWNSISGSILVVKSPNDFPLLLIISIAMGGIIVATFGIIIFIKKRTKKPRDKDLDTIESIIN
ncbi:MAG: DUF2341 domain-containing protein [Candidatus Hodarchaeota archaeon]